MATKGLCLIKIGKNCETYTLDSSFCPPDACKSGSVCRTKATGGYKCLLCVNVSIICVSYVILLISKLNSSFDRARIAILLKIVHSCQTELIIVN